jgi:hypothetical protein
VQQFGAISKDLKADDLLHFYLVSTFEHRFIFHGKALWNF